MEPDILDEFGREVCELADRYELPFVMVTLGKVGTSDLEIFANVREDEIQGILKEAAAGITLSDTESVKVSKVDKNDLN